MVRFKPVLSALVLATATALFFGGVVSGTAVGASTAQRTCEADGGTYTKAGSDSICVYPEESIATQNSGGNANGNNNSQTTQDTDTGQGTLKNKTESQCEGPPGQCR
jgi:hypothetical protein